MVRYWMSCRLHLVERRATLDRSRSRMRAKTSGCSRISCRKIEGSSAFVGCCTVVPIVMFLSYYSSGVPAQKQQGLLETGGRVVETSGTVAAKPDLTVPVDERGKLPS